MKFTRKLSDRDQASALEFASALADEASRLGSLRAVKVNYKADQTPVTEIDLAIENMVREAVRTERPDEAVLGEEYGFVPGDLPRKVWVIDPVDGTELLANGEAGYVFSAALVVDGEPEIAVVRDPNSGDTWYGAAGWGAWKGTRDLKVSGATALRGAKVRIPSGARNPQFVWDDVVSTADERGVLPLPRGSAVRTGMSVAEGTIDGMVFGRFHPWDVATSALIVTEAGGVATSLDGLLQRYDMGVNGAILAPAGIHDELVQIVRQRQLVR